MSMSEHICTHLEFDPMAELNREDPTIYMIDNSTGNKRNSK